jgi:hypothetical protein
MPLPTYNVLDGSVLELAAPRVPVIADFGGNAYINDPKFPPEPPDQIPAEGVNQLVNAAVAACAMMKKASFTVSRSASTLTLLGFRACNVTLAAGDVSLVLADPLTVGENVLVIRWAKGQLPAAVTAPSATIVSRGRNQLTAKVASYVDGTYAGITVAVDNAGSASTAFTVQVECDGEGAFG